MGCKKYKPLFISEESHARFKQAAAKKKKKINEYFDEMVIPKIEVPNINFNVNFIDLKKPLKNKKGNVFLEIGFIVVFLVALIIGFIYLQPFNEDIKEIIQTDDTISNESKNLAIPQLEKYETKTDTWVLFMFGFLWITTIATSFFVDSNPLFFLVSFVIFVGMLSGIVYFGNVTEEILINDHASILHLYPNSFWIASHLLEIVIPTSLFIFISLFAKRQVSGG